MKKVRNSNVELLRIIAIFMVVISHYSVHNGIDNSLLPLSINRFFLEGITLGNVGVILFVMITGYFMSENKGSIKLNKLLILYLQVLFYSLGVFILSTFLGLETFSLKSLIKYMFPFIFHQYWFVTAYIILYIFSPFINKLLDNLSKKENVIFILVLCFFVSILPTFTLKDFYGNELFQFILFYCLGAYFKKYNDNIFSRNKKFNYIMLIISSLLLFLSIFVIDFLQVKFGFDIVKSTYFLNRNSLLAIFFAISLFNSFVNKKDFYSKGINVISSCVFGIYLLSDHNIVRKFLWVDLFDNAAYAMKDTLILHFVVSVFCVFMFCGIVEIIRKNTVEKIIFNFLSEKNGVSFDDNLKKIFKKLS